MTDSLKNMIQSVDWSKLMSSSDAKNALVGSALGGLMLGGASLAAPRDPEESKYRPVGDALLGAVLGGAAGYGIPKGLSMFRDAGHMAPDNDRISGGALGAAGHGFALGAGAIGASAGVTTLAGLIRAMRNAGDAHEDRQAAAFTRADYDRDAAARAEADNVLRGGHTPNRAVRAAQFRQLASAAKASVFGYRGTSYSETMKELNAALNSAVANHDDTAVRAIKSIIAETRSFHRRVWLGIGTGRDGIDDLGKIISNEARKPVKGWVKHIPFAGTVRNLNNGSHYKPVNIGKLKIGPYWRMLGRAGKFGVGGAALAVLLNKLVGANSRNNFKN